MTKQELERKAREVLDNEGFREAFIVMSEEEDIDIRYCPTCREESPVVRGTKDCLICGKDTIPSPYDEDIPLENKEE